MLRGVRASLAPFAVHHAKSRQQRANKSLHTDNLQSLVASSLRFRLRVSSGFRLPNADRVLGSITASYRKPKTNIRVTVSKIRV
jgi:hypothetical protein